MDSQVWIYVLVGAVFTVAIVIQFVIAHRRRKAAQQWADAHGWTYTRSDGSLVKRWSSPPFRRGSSRAAINVLTGTWNGRSATSFTYKYTTGSGKNRTTHYHHVVAFSLPARLPWLRLEPEGVGDSIAKFFGGQDIEFESAQFNDRWRVKGPEGQFPYDFLHPRMMERLLQPDAYGSAITVEGADIYFWRSGKQELSVIAPALHLLSGIVDQIPRFLWLKVGYDPNASGTARHPGV
ncbi:hypothetical protein [Ruania zhangjianzhongii]|uniref:hypothetical protein n=1 Tax=Ruania zhangjianzhongii TaxID=2603206 RepID=UPI0011CBCE81|nr:hypothetical protein [Ruania zhangjianzhongii]